MKAKSIKGTSPDEIQAALDQSKADGFAPTLSIVFISIKQDRDAVCAILHKEGIDVVGATSCGEFVEGFQGEGSIVILLLDLHRDYYTILFEGIGDRRLTDVAAQLARAALKKFKRPAFILCSTGVSAGGKYFGGETLVSSIGDVVGSDVNIFGGMAGDDGRFTGTYVFTDRQSTDEGIAALILDEDKVSLHGIAISGWKPLGTTKTVTKSEDSWVYTIDGQPALEMYLRYLGKQQLSGDGTVNIFEELGFYYPFLAIDAGDPQIRTPLMIDTEKHAIKLDFHIPEGKTLQFAVPPDFDIVENVLTSATEIKNSTQLDADALLIFSCAGRHSALGPMISSENEGLHDIWNAPMAGFFTYGEYGKSIDGKQRFHSTTCSWVALKEK
jgi:Uncharacterized conserved protein